MSFHHFFGGFVSPSWCNEASILYKTVRVICTRVMPSVDESSRGWNVYKLFIAIPVTYAPFHALLIFWLIIVLKIPRLHAKWMREMKQFVHQFGCWHSFSAINGVVSFSPEFLEKTMEGERERERKDMHPKDPESIVMAIRARLQSLFIQTCSNLCWTPSCVSPSGGLSMRRLRWAHCQGS